MNYKLCSVALTTYSKLLHENFQRKSGRKLRRQRKLHIELQDNVHSMSLVRSVHKCTDQSALQARLILMLSTAQTVSH